MISRNLKRGAYIVCLFSLSLFTVFFLLLTDTYALDINREELDNGLVLLTVERHDLPVVEVSVGIKAGNVREPSEKAGLANLTAVLLTEGTENRTAQEISESIEFVGGSLASSGGYDYSTVRLSVLKKDMDLGFDLLSDVVLHPVFPQSELNKKRERIKGSLKAREEDPGFVASKQFKKALFGDHPYGRLVSGAADTLDRITREDLVHFHKAHFAPNNAVMAVVGDISQAEVKGLLEKYFDEWRPAAAGLPGLPDIEGLEEKKVIRVDRNITQANIVLGHSGVRRDNPEYYAISVMNYILGRGGFASRLMQNVREEKGLVYDIRSFFDANRYGGSFQAVFQTKNSTADEALEALLNEIRRIRKEPVTDTELSDARSFLIGSFPMRIETSRKIANFLVAVEYYGLGMDYAEKYPSYIKEVTVDDVLNAARKYLDPETYILVIVSDQEKTFSDSAF